MKFTNLIAWWPGSIASIPHGWTLCDGNNGTPDLRNQFPIAAGTGGTLNPSDTGGALTHIHDFTGDGHDHDVVGDRFLTDGEFLNVDTTVDPAVGTTDPGSNVPPYKALLPIMVL